MRRSLLAESEDIPVSTALELDAPDVEQRFLLGIGGEHLHTKSDPVAFTLLFPTGQGGPQVLVRPVVQHGITSGYQCGFGLVIPQLDACREPNEVARTAWLYDADRLDQLKSQPMILLKMKQTMV